MPGTIVKISDLTNRLTEIIVILFFLIVVCAASLQVFSRYVLNYSFSWTEEAARFAFIWLNMLGACVCLKRGTHAAITVLIDLFPARLKKAIQIISNLSIIFVAGIMFFQGLKVVSITMAQPSPALGLPMSLIYLCVPVAGLIMALHALAFIAELISGEPVGGKN